jgi:hypothetical protein
MSALEPSQAWSEAHRLSGRARGDRRASSVPLLAFGLLTIVSAPLMNTFSLWRLFYWVIAGPAGLVFIAWYYRRRRIRTGTGSGRGSYARAALLLLGSFVLLIPLLVVPLPAVAAVLAVLAVRQRNAYLGLCAVCFGLVGALETFGVFDNLLYKAAHRLGWFTPHSGYFNGAPVLIYARVGVLMVGAGLLALQYERRLSRE